MEVVNAKIESWEQDGTVLIRASLPDIDRAILRQYEDVLVGFSDGRMLKVSQRKKIYALLGEIAEYSMGYRDSSTVETVKEQLKLEFITHRQQALAVKMFSLSDTDCTTAREFIDYLVSFIVEWGIPTKEPLVKYCEDIQRFVYQCLIHKKCAVCGRGAQFCHYDSVGMGRNRHEIPQIGVKVFPACAKHHQEAHQIGHDTWMKKYHLEPVVLTKKIAKIWGLSKKNMEEI